MRRRAVVPPGSYLYPRYTSVSALMYYRIGTSLLASRAIRPPAVLGSAGALNEALTAHRSSETRVLESGILTAFYMGCTTVHYLPIHGFSQRSKSK